MDNLSLFHFEVSLTSNASLRSLAGPTKTKTHLETRSQKVSTRSNRLPRLLAQVAPWRACPAWADSSWGIRRCGSRGRHRVIAALFAKATLVANRWARHHLCLCRRGELWEARRPAQSLMRQTQTKEHSMSLECVLTWNFQISRRKSRGQELAQGSLVVVWPSFV